MQNLIRREKLGEGTYGVVYRALNPDTQCLVAIKNIRFHHDDEGIPSAVIREIALLKELKHPNIVELQDVNMMEKEVHLIFEYLAMDLHRYFEILFSKGEKMHAKSIQSFLYQITEAILFCHRRRILHRDLKPQNLLIDPTHTRIKVGDFGLSRAFDLPVRSYSPEVITLWYRAPELLLGCPQYCCPVDIWSIGCIFFEMLTGRTVFPGESEIDQLICIFKILGTPTEENWMGVTQLPNYSSSFPIYPINKLTMFVRKDFDKNLNASGVDLLNRMLCYQPSQRIVAKDIVKHAFFQGMPDNMK
ncbi:cyclin-dependent kinase 1 [Drosophila willistoni]|uniref:cyclin-dependent kinase 1 n=1 Tax=Drosophila willistoni TaxID=7260 RepID=UPI00017D870E|nr:cyclin-dependent kinase 1 [Drosophila willistoni]